LSGRCGTHVHTVQTPHTGGRGYWRKDPDPVAGKETAVVKDQRKKKFVQWGSGVTMGGEGRFRHSGIKAKLCEAKTRGKNRS